MAKCNSIRICLHPCSVPCYIYIHSVLRVFVHMQTRNWIAPRLNNTYLNFFKLDLLLPPPPSPPRNQLQLSMCNYCEKNSINSNWTKSNGLTDWLTAAPNAVHPIKTLTSFTTKYQCLMNQQHSKPEQQKKKKTTTCVRNRIKLQILLI